MPERHQDARIAEIVVGLMHLARNLDPADFDDLVGAVGVEVDTGMELILERRMRRPADGNVVAFPGSGSRQARRSTPGAPKD